MYCVARLSTRFRIEFGVLVFYVELNNFLIFIPYGICVIYELVTKNICPVLFD